MPSSPLTDFSFGVDLILYGSMNKAELLVMKSERNTERSWWKEREGVLYVIQPLRKMEDNNFNVTEQ